MKWIKSFEAYKEPVKEPTIEELQDTINSANNFLKTSKNIIDIDYYIDERIDNLLKMNGFKNLLEPRSYKEFNLKPFVRYEKKKDCWIGFIIKYEKNSYIVYSYVIYKTKAEKGTIYFFKDKHLNIFTAHFFDRYYQRIIDPNNKIPSEKLRDKAIINYIKIRLKQDVVIGTAVKKLNGNKAMAAYSNGIALGYIVADLDASIMMTFVDKELWRTKQNKEAEEFYKDVEVSTKQHREEGGEYKPKW